MTVSVILPTHNPHPGRLARALAALREQTLPPDNWELLLVDNASNPPLRADDLRPHAPSRLRILREPTLGLTSARRCGLRAASGSICVLVDDDNVLAPDYLARTAQLFAEHAQLGAAGGRILPEFETAPQDWHREFFPLLALRDHGDEPVVATRLRPPGAARDEYPAAAAPVGAGLALRRSAVASWLDATRAAAPADRTGRELTSGGDNDIVLSVLKSGWHVGYFPALSLVHLIPAARLETSYLARLNRGIQKSWMQVLAHHAMNPWPPIPSWTVPLRQARAWLTQRAWTSPAAHIRWQGACGHFEGRVGR